MRNTAGLGQPRETSTSSLHVASGKPMKSTTQDFFISIKSTSRPDQPDELTLALTVDNAPLKTILRQLYYPDSPFEFSVIPARYPWTGV